ncbi:MAG TPA: proline--tRNA ligase [Spirochaetota bacterium]|nr:proline--tRNA ligase [Spirochaetota bacterium]HOM38025.1 proline--tRNA ligase [Spirochaetota bacterium]HPQ48829.1 proline--tRNA ligase [Spirochaetota bacterium]
MRISRIYFNTLKEVPKDATVKSHILMMRAGLIVRLSSGIYAYSPIGYRSIKKIIDIIREEMDRIGAQEFLLPILTQKELWVETGRYELMKNLMFKTIDKNGQEYILGPTHEEVFSDIIRRYLNSYRQLPLIVYQVYKKFRDEIRPRFGVMRGREFIMKDAYSYHRDSEDLDKTYQDMRIAYRRFFIRCGLDTVPVMADSGAMGGKESEEFMVRSTIGEETIIECLKCGYVANSERAISYKEYVKSNEELKNIEQVYTPSVKTIEELIDFFKVSPQKFIKSLVYKTEDGENILALIRGDLEINEVKLSNAIGGKPISLADEETVRKIGSEIGFVGPVGISNLRIIADESVKYIVNGITGANKKDYHIKNVTPEKDFKVEKYIDISLTKENDLCINCKTPLKSFKGIEVGHIFKLGYKYSNDMNIEFLDENGNKVKPIMGCYGIGIDRTLATVIEQSSDEYGIIWPITIAPFKVIVIPLVENCYEIADKIYNNLLNEGIDTLIDDRQLSPGIKFNDADLIGIPIRVTIGKNWVKNGVIEIKLRDGSGNYEVNENTVIYEIKKIIEIKEKEIKQKLDSISKMV